MWFILGSFWLRMLNPKTLMEVVTAVMMMIEKPQIREMMMKKNLTPIYLKTFFYMIVMMS